MQEIQAPRSKRWIFWGLVVLGAVLVLAAIGMDVLRRARGMRSATTPVASILAGPVGASIKAVVRLDNSIDPRTYSVELLESKAENVYRDANAHIRLELTDDTAVVMGSASDVKIGAVVQVSGTVDEGRTVHARQLVILTGYVRVVPE